MEVKPLITIGTGTSKTEIYDLKEFECFSVPRQWNRNKEITSHKDCGCKGIGYIIPKSLEPYEIKKVSEIKLLIKGLDSEHQANKDFNDFVLREHNLKEDDKIVIKEE